MDETPAKALAAPPPGVGVLAAKASRNSVTVCVRNMLWGLSTVRNLLPKHTLGHGLVGEPGPCGDRDVTQDRSKRHKGPAISARSRDY